MSWFKKTLTVYGVDGSPLTEEDKDNPYITEVEEEEFEKVLIKPIDGLVIPPVQAEVVNGSSSKSSNLSSK